MPFEQLDVVPALAGGQGKFLSGAVDASIGIGGYRLSRMDRFATPTSSVLDLLEAHNISAGRVECSSWEELSVARVLLGRRKDQNRQKPVIFGGGPILVDREPRSEREWWIDSTDDIARAVQMHASLATGWLPVGCERPDLAYQAVEQAHRVGLRVAYSGTKHALDSLEARDHVSDLPGILREPGDSPLRLLQRWSEQQEIPRGLDGNPTVGSGLLALRRSVFVREAMEAPFLEELAPILPHAAYIREMKRPGGYLAAKRKLRENAGLVEPSRAEAQCAEAGWQQLLAIASAMDGLVPASRAPQFTSLPGYAWHEECSILGHAGVQEPLAHVARFCAGMSDDEPVDPASPVE